MELRAVSNMKALGKPLNAKQTAVPRCKRENPLCCPCVKNENFLGFHVKGQSTTLLIILSLKNQTSVATEFSSKV